MLIATWNVNSINARRDYFLDWLETRRPDIACLQELKVVSEDFPYDEISGLGYHAAVHGQKSWNGVAVVAKRPLTLLREGLPGQEDAGARVVTADVDDILVTSVYVPNGKSVAHPDFEMKLAWLKGLLEYLTEMTEGGRPLLVGGDFNLVPADIDSYHPEEAAGTIFHTDAERDFYRRVLDLGLVDAYRRAAPDEPGYSWWDYRGGSFHKGRGLRIDLLLASPTIAERVSAVAVDRTFRKKRPNVPEVKPSDHAPVEAVLSE